jgi:hypothetical protein
VHKIAPGLNSLCSMRPPSADETTTRPLRLLAGPDSLAHVIAIIKRSRAGVLPGRTSVRSMIKEGRR